MQPNTAFEMFSSCIHIHYLPISNWRLLTLHLLLKICKNAQQIMLKLQRCKVHVISHIFWFQFCPKSIQGTKNKLNVEHHVCEHPVKSVASNAFSLQYLFMMLLSNICVHLFDSSFSIHGNIIDYLKNMEFFVNFLFITSTIFLPIAT